MTRGKPRHRPPVPRKPTQAEKEDRILRLLWDRVNDARQVGNPPWFRRGEHWVFWYGKTLKLKHDELLKCCSLADLRQYVEFEYAVQRVRGT